MSKSVLALIIISGLAFVMLSRGRVRRLAPWVERGMNIVTWWHDTYQSPQFESSLLALRGTNTEWASFLTTWYQDTITSSEVKYDPQRTPSDASLRYAIGRARTLGFLTTLKPHIDLYGPGWRGQIDPADKEQWFGSYRDFILHYAILAQMAGVERLVIGTELEQMTKPQYEERWRFLIQDIRAAYRGSITYAANWDEWPQITWWDALDFIGIDAYYPLSLERDPTQAELEAGWYSFTDEWGTTRRAFDEIRGLAQRYGRRVLFTEMGYRSADFAALHPWDSSAAQPYNGELQARLYRAAMNVLGGESWFAGFYWWAWDADQSYLQPEDTSFTPAGKPAQAVLTEYYRRKR